METSPTDHADNPISSRTGWWVLAVALLAAWTVRGIIYAGVEFMPKINGAYYLVQARSVLETGKPGIPDLPLLFYLHAALAGMLKLLGFGDQASCITLAVKISDTVLPPLTAVPIFLLVRDWMSSRGKGWLAAIAVLLFTTLNESTFTLLADFQKNGFGMIWMLGFILAVHRAGQHMSWKRLAWVGFMLLLAGVTHIGVFGATASFAALAAVAYLLLLKEHRRKILISLGIGVALLGGLIAVVKTGFDPKRADHLTRLMEEPLKLFQGGREGAGGRPQGPPGAPGGMKVGPPGMTPPMPGGMRGGPPGMGGFTIMGVAVNQTVVIHVIACLAVLILLRHWSAVTAADRAIVLAALLLALFLDSPLLDFDHGMRFGLMAFAPGAVLLAFALSHWKSTWGSRLLAVLVIGWVVLGANAGLSMPMNRHATVADEAMPELKSMSQFIKNPPRTLVVARHGLEWWAAWTLKTKIAHADAVLPEDFSRYEKVLYLQQTGGQMMPGGPPPMQAQGGAGPPPGLRGPRGPGAGPRGGPFAEAAIPSDAHILFKGQYFTLAEAASEAEVQLDVLKGGFGNDLPF